MSQTVLPRSEIAKEHTWDTESIFSSDAEWESAMARLVAELPELARFRGKLGESAATLLDWLQTADELRGRLAKVRMYAGMTHAVDTTDQAGTAEDTQAQSLFSRATAMMAFAEPEMLQLSSDTLRQWMSEEPALALYEHYFDRLERRRTHVRSSEVEELLGQVTDPFNTAARIHGTLADADLRFVPARTASGESIDIEQGNLSALVVSPDRELRRTAWESYADAHLALKNTMANCLAAGVKQDVFMARARGYSSSLEAATTSNNIPVEVFHSLIDTYRQNLPIWHRYWRVRRLGLGHDWLHVYDIKAPLTASAPAVSFDRSVEWISEGMRPLGNEYVDTMRRGLTEQRWVDLYPNQGKRSGAFSAGAKGTHPFILMSYTDDIFSMSTLAHELGHSLHSYFAWQTQPLVYSRYGLFVAEVASNFNQAMVRAHLLDTNTDPDFQIAVIEEAMPNFHRYFFIMPALARFELEIHERTERGEPLTADNMIALMADLFQEGYGDEVEIDRDRIGITWAQFSTHLYSNFYVYQYATGISAAHALSRRVLRDGSGAAADYLAFLKAGASLYPLDALKLAGVDMESPEPVEATFGVLGELVDRLELLLQQR